MKDFAAKTATNMATNQFKKKISKQFESNEGIDWTDLNYPPGLKLLHYDIKEVDASKKLIMHLIHGYFCLQSILFLLNFTNAIVQTASGYSWTRMLASVFYYFIIVLLAGFCFYSAFQAFVGVRAGSLMFKIGMGVLFFLFLLQLIFDTLSWNGLARVIHIFQDGNTLAGLLSLFEFFVILGQAGFAGYLVFGFVKAEMDTSGPASSSGTKKKAAADKKEDKSDKA